MKTVLALSAAMFAATVSMSMGTQAAAAGGASTARAPVPPGRAILNRSCTSCHDSSQATQVRAAADWQPIVNRMRDNGASISDADAKVLVAYLVQNYSRAH